MFDVSGFSAYPNCLHKYASSAHEGGRGKFGSFNGEQDDEHNGVGFVKIAIITEMRRSFLD